VRQSHIDYGQIVFRQWDDTEGLSETTRDFESLEELFHFCLEAHDPLLVDRVYIRGFDADGNPRKLTLVFQSITISEGKS
jgi:hypothetical protein